MVPLLQNWRKKYSPLHIGYLWVIGLLGWFLLAFFLFTHGLRPYNRSEYYVLGATILTAILCRLLTFNVYDNVKIAIDTAYYVVISFIIEPLAAALIAALALFFDTILRFAWRRFYSDEEPLKPSYFWGQAFFNGGVPVIVIITITTLVGTTTTALNDWQIATKFAIFTILFLLWHYMLASIASLVQGRTIVNVLTHFYIGVVGYELSMIPIGICLLLGYMHQGVWFFMTLTAAYLICNYLCRRLADQNLLSHKRATQLATLNNVGQYISAKLQMEDLIAIVAEYSRNLVHRTPSSFIFGLINEHSALEYTLFDEKDGHISAPKSGDLTKGLAEIAMNSRHPLRIDDLPQEMAHYQLPPEEAPPHIHSWLGIPLIADEELLGIIILQSEQRAAYDEETVTALSTIARQTSIAVQNAKLYQLATRDGLSKLYVRRYFDQRINDEWHRAKRTGNSLALLMLDLDDFKSFNDKYGHQAGDMVIKRSAELVLKGLRSADIVARYGGEEFAFILPDTGLKAALSVAERIVNRIANERLEYEGHTFSITASIGVAAMPENEPQSCAELISMADQALYFAKKSGKNCSRVFAKEL